MSFQFACFGLFPLPETESESELGYAASAFFFGVVFAEAPFFFGGVHFFLEGTFLPGEEL
jgi:hypothetical protein